MKRAVEESIQGVTIMTVNEAGKKWLASLVKEDRFVIKDDQHIQALLSSIEEEEDLDE
jgi:hypothetical protein